MPRFERRVMVDTMMIEKNWRGGEMKKEKKEE